MRSSRLLFIALAALPFSAFGQGGSFGAKNPFSAPDAFVHYAPDRMYDLQNLVLDLNVDYPNRLLKGTSTNYIQAIRNGVTQLRFHAGADTKIEGVELNGHTATFKRDDEGILVDCPPTKEGEKWVVAVHYHFKKSEVTHGRGGWHWHEPAKNDPSHVGFWTNGETEDTRDWAVTWDYPNDFTTSETHTTVPADWEVIGNGSMISDKVNEDGKTRTVVWRMTQPHATYLTSVMGGPLDIHRDNWRGVPLYYVAPKGMGNKLDYSFGHTKDMLSFYSDNLGVKYPWPKYAQDCTYDFGGGQENVSATTLGIFLTDPRQGYYEMDSLTSHELGHQWFGDFVTCKDWGQIWLNESFATYMEMSYTLHSRGINESQREVESNSRGYIQESHRYKRPLATNFYSDAGVMFDQHTYPKGGVLLFSLRKLVGEKAFYSGLHRYLTLHQNSPVESNDLCEAMTDATGINLHPWFEQWIYKPGHPVIDWSWAWDEASKKVSVHVKQTQDTSAGTPIYDIPATVGLLSKEGKVERAPIHLNAADQTFTLAASQKPDAVVFDPDHDFMREIPKQPWAPSELMTVAAYAPDCVLRQQAVAQIIAAKPSDADLQALAGILERDKGIFPAIEDTGGLSRLKRADLKPFWESELNHESFARRAEAVRALAELPADSVEGARIRALVDDKQPYDVVAAAIAALDKLDYDASKAQILEQASKAENTEIRSAALEAVLHHDQQLGATLTFKALEASQPDSVRSAGFAALGSVKGDDPRITGALREALSGSGFRGLFQALNIIAERKMKDLIPDLEALKKKNPRLGGFIDQTIQRIKS